MESIEYIHKKGILKGIVILVMMENQVIERFFIRINWMTSLFGLNEIDKLSTPINVENELGNALRNIYEKPISRYNGETFKIVVETHKEEAADVEELMSNTMWDVVTLECHEPLSQHTAKVENLIELSWGHESISQSG
ncbi:unnamed protein product [Blepharisma stoltei]|uniref:Uncharacterized protein n=1 Tax=Blepharisma stoltei TaxID=1481888 RepID=A0AAU9II88_9CILI|nr:unnamed protein product [Blepharisma stoltei]